MRAAIYRGSGDITIEDHPMPSAGPDEILIRVAAVGICGTDAHEYESGPLMFPIGAFIPGHEVAGHVVEIGSAVAGFSVGDLVAVGAGISCGECHWCQSGATSVCATYVTLGLQLPGGLAQYIVAPAAICMEVGSRGISPDTAALAQPMSIAVHSMKRGRPQPCDVAVVIGAGGIGAFLIYALAQHGVSTVAIDLDPERLELASALGAGSVVHPENATEVLSDRVPSVIYEVTGSPSGLDLALALTAPRSRVVIIGLQDGAHPIEFRRLALGENELIGTNAHAFAADFDQAIDLLAGRTEGWSEIAPVAIPLDDLVDQGLRPMIEGRATRIKTLIDPWATESRATIY